LLIVHTGKDGISSPFFSKGKEKAHG
jgi:hypothetical protein